MTQFLGVDNCHGLGAPNLELHKLPGLRGYLSPLVNRLPLIDKAIRCFNLLRSHLRRDVLEYCAALTRAAIATLNHR